MTDLSPDKPVTSKQAYCSSECPSFVDPTISSIQGAKAKKKQTKKEASEKREMRVVIFLFLRFLGTRHTNEWIIFISYRRVLFFA